jgi:hypothetical protein
LTKPKTANKEFSHSL